MFPSLLVFYKNLALTIYTAIETLSLGGTQQPNILWTDLTTADSNTFYNQPNLLWLALITLPRYDQQNNVLWTSTFQSPRWVQQPNTEWTDTVTLTIPGSNLQP